MRNIQTRRALTLVAFLFWCTASVMTTSAFAQQTPVESPIREFRGQTMGTTYMVKVFGAQAVDDDALRFGVDGELRRVNDQMSTYLESSEITAFNKSKSTDWFEVSEHFAHVVELAQSISRSTDGAFDITVGPLVDAWSFGTTKRSNTVPDEALIADISGRIGFQKLHVRLDPPALKKDIPDLRIDLSAIAKGHGVDRVVSKLAELGAHDVFVEVGGEVRTSGSKSDVAWRVGIQLPDAVRDTVMIAHEMVANAPSGNAMATSGDYRNAFTVDGQRYSHTIDPRTGAPVTHQLASVTVIAETCMEADAWATALNVVGPNAGAEIAAKHNLDALLVSRTNDKDFQMNGTGILAQYAQTGTPVTESGTSWLSALIPIAILTFGIMSILLFAMAIGVVFGRRSISGSCGGLANKTNEDGSSSCALCSNPSDACKELRDKMAENQTAGSPE